MGIWKRAKKYGIKECMFKIFNKLRKAFLCLVYGAGSMEKYFLMKDRYENGSQKISLDTVRKYGRLVTSQAWVREKENEKDMIVENIIQGKQKFDDKYQKEIAYCRSRGECMLYPYAFTEKYLAHQKDVQVYNDGTGKNSLKYVLHCGKKLYFPNLDCDEIKHQYTQLVMEQDPLSPHAYFDSGAKEYRGGGIFVDVGSAEGIISLDIVDRVREIYLIEGSRNWVRALEATFKDYRDKVHIINKYAGNENSKTTIRLDDLLAQYKNEKIFIKMDIEGMELEALGGCLRTMKNNDCVFACAAYHTNTMEEKLLSIFRQNGYKAQVSDGYMLFIYGHMTLQNGMYEKMEYPYFRRGLVRAAR